MRNNYLRGGMGYGQAKEVLFVTIMEKYAKERELYNHYMGNRDELEKQLKIGADKARVIAHATLSRVRRALGYGSNN